MGVPLRAPRPLIAACTRASTRMNLVDAGPHAMSGPTDALAFLAHGLPAISVVGFADGQRLPNYHTPNDTVAAMDFEAAWLGAAFACAVAWEIATSVDTLVVAD